MYIKEVKNKKKSGLFTNLLPGQGLWQPVCEQQPPLVSAGGTEAANTVRTTAV